MKILMVSSEAVPFAKSGGLADVVGALSDALADSGVDVRVLIPCYGNMDLAGFGPSICSLEVPLHGSVEVVEIRERILGKVRFYVACHPWYTARKGIYGDTSFTPYGDNFVRFLLQAKLIHPLCKSLRWTPDVIHCHDWTAGFVPYLVKTDANPAFAKTKTMFTIHNLAYQGDFPRLDVLMADVLPDQKMFVGEGPRKRVNMLKTGIEFADIVTTVSPTYAKEIQRPEYGCGLDGLLQARKDSLYGIINGIDYKEWNPATDVNFNEHFTADEQAGKTELKALVQQEFGLPVNPDVPLISMISRIAEQKGFNELLEGSPCALEMLLEEMPLQMLIIGTGDKRLEEKLQVLGDVHENLSVNIIFSDRAAHRVEAASDFFLMPSRYEPCGLNQLYSLRYGTLPIARRTGGLADSIIDLSDDPDNGTGILFDEASGAAIVSSVRRAMHWWDKGRKELAVIRKRAMESDFTWTRSAKAYLDIYKNMTKKG